ncbi:MAG TPA: hypothetical protein VJT73_11510 [Polyangiaceae bacterium]|nr:hypothetical protein [Polyangiaceae bacterium]
MRTALGRLGVVFLLVGCSSSSALPGGPTTSDAGGGPALSVSMSLSVPSGKELHQCQFVTLPNDTDIEAVALSHHYSAGSHHFLVYLTDLAEIPSDLRGQYDCVNGDEPVMQHTRGIIYGAQSREGGSKLPQGVGLRFKAKQVLMLQAHYLNSSKDPIEATVSLDLSTAPKEQIETEASFFLFYDPFIYVPAQGTASSGIRCEAPANISVMSSFTHYHQRGKSMKVWLDPSMAAPTSEGPFHETDDWEHPEDFTGPKPIPAGSVFRIQCDYANPDTTDVFQGPNAATSEMCVYAGIYYPKLDADFEQCQNLSVDGSGTDTCMSQVSCVQQCPASEAPKFTPGGVLVGPCWEKCVAKGCTGGTDRLLPFITCVSNKCSEACAGGGTECDTCAVSQCASEFSACATHQCSK